MAVPVPLKFTVVVGLVGSLLVIESAPDEAVVVVGLKVTVRVADWPALITFGVVIPVAPKPVPLTDITETVRSAFPAFEIVRFEVDCVLTVTLPKLIAALLTEICGVEATPVAARLTTAGALPAAPRTESVPLTGPLAVGVTLTDTVLDCPAATVIGRVIPLSLNCGLETVACETVAEAVPEFRIVTVRLLDFPTVTFPKFTEAGFN